MPSVRAATEIDLPSILAIYNEVIATSTAVYALEPATLDERCAWFTSRSARGFPVVVAAAPGGDVLGFASFGDWRGAWPGYRYTVEHSVHVRADVRGRGIGRALVESLFPLALGQGKHVMIGSIDAANDASIRFHERLGFERVAHFQGGRPQIRSLARSRFHAAPSRPTRHHPIMTAAPRGCWGVSFGARPRMG
jgi:phosphinothricin acetyltransferase